MVVRPLRLRDDPPPLTLSVRGRHKFRYILEGEGVNPTENYTLISGDMLVRRIVVASDTVTGYAIIRAVRILDVELWAISQLKDNQNATTEVFLEYPNTPNVGPGGPDLRKGDTTLGSARAAHVRYPPPRNSLQAEWLNRNAVSVLGIKAPAGAVLDITLDFILEDSGTVQSSTLSSASPGEIYYLSLDCMAPGGNYWRPAGGLNYIDSS